MNRRTFLETAALLSVGGMLTTSGIPDANAASSTNATVLPDPALLKPIQDLMGYSDDQFKSFLKNPRNLKMLSQLKNISQITVVCEIVKVHGCMAGHRVGEKFLFPSGGSMDTRNSAEKLCPFLMPPMTRLVWIIQERAWEGLDPAPLFPRGHCDDVGYDCNGLGCVVIEARIEKTKKSG